MHAREVKSVGTGHNHGTHRIPHTNEPDRHTPGPDHSLKPPSNCEIVFLGSPPEAQGALRALHDAGHEVALVVTQPDRKRGRGGDLVPSPVKRTATELGLTVVTPERCKEALDDIAGSAAELGVVVAFGQLIPPSVLAALPSGYVNVHFSLLPRWRGAAPVERAMLAGDEETGVCLMQLEAGLDTGPVYACRTVKITPDDTAGDLRRRLADLGTELLLSEVESIPGRTPTPRRARRRTPPSSPSRSSPSTGPARRPSWPDWSWPATRSRERGRPPGAPG